MLRLKFNFVLQEYSSFIYVNCTNKAATTQSPTKNPTTNAPTTTTSSCVDSFNKVIIQSTRDDYLQLYEVQVMSGGINVALNNPAIQSSTWLAHAASRGVDGDNSTFFHTQNGVNEWFMVDLNAAVSANSIDFVNKDCGANENTARCLCRLSNANVILLDASNNTVSTIPLGNTCGKATITNAITQCTKSPTKQPTKVSYATCLINSAV